MVNFTPDFTFSLWSIILFTYNQHNINFQIKKNAVPYTRVDSK